MSYEHPDTHLAEIIVSEGFGVALVAGPDRLELLAPLAASASLVTFLEEGRVEEIAAHVDELGTETDIVAADDLGSLPPFSMLLLGRLAESDVEEDLDRLLGAVADDGLVLCDLPVMPRPLRLRVERLLSRLLVDVVDLKHLAEPGALVLSGRRKPRGREFSTTFDPEPPSVTVYVYSERATEDLNLLVLDILHRQSTPPALLIVLDDAADEADQVPDDLWGLAGNSFTQPAIMRTNGVGRVAALKLGLEQFETRYLAFLEAPCRLAALWCWHLVEALDAVPELSAAVCGGIERLPDGDLDEHVLKLEDGVGNPLALLLAGEPPTCSALMFRDGPALDLSEVPAEIESEIGFDMLLRAAEDADVASVPLPLVVYEAADLDLDARRIAIERFAGRERLDRLEDGLAMFTEEDREGLARHVLGGALHDAGSLENAIAVYEEALEHEPDLRELRIDLMRAIRETGDLEALQRAAEDALESDPDDAAYRIVRATALAELGRFEGLEESLDIEADDEETALAYNRVAVAALRIDDPELNRALERLSDKLADDGEFGDLAELVIFFD